MASRCAVLLDVDGTLVDSNYLHTLSWARAFRRGDRTVLFTDIHRCIGMGGDQLMQRLIGEEDEQIHAWSKEEFATLRDEVRPTPGAADLVRALAERGATVVYATSGSPDDTEALRRTIGADRWVDAVVNAGEVDSSKPSPNIFEVALERAGVGADAAIVVGDTVWDVEAARSCGLRCVTVLSGGISRAELEAAGAAAVYRSPQDLLDRLDAGPVGELLRR
jgi:HAD superfamily hydrolase (TIGR01509 family)